MCGTQNACLQDFLEIKQMFALKFIWNIFKKCFLVTGRSIQMAD